MEYKQIILNALSTILEVLNFLSQYLPEALLGLLLIVMGSGLMTLFTRTVGREKSRLYKMNIVNLFFLIEAGLVYLSTTPNLPPWIVPLVAPAMFVLSQPLYIKVFKPLSIKFGDDIREAANFNAKKAGLIESPVLEPADFPTR